MKFNPKIHKRKSIRLKGYDYSQEGLYFITICVQNRENLFGEIENGEMVLNDSGKMIEKWYYELMNKFPDIKCDAMIVMPNHFHCIIENVGTVVETAVAVAADLRVCPDPDINGQTDRNENGQTDLSAENGQTVKNVNIQTDLSAENGQTHRSAPTINENPILGEHKGSPLHTVVQWFKTMSTNEYIRGVKNLGWQPFNGKVWQRNYYEHIIRDERAYQNISNYIINNPAKWQEDKLK